MLKEKMKKDLQNYRARLSEVKNINEAWKFINKKRKC